MIAVNPHFRCSRMAQKTARARRQAVRARLEDTDQVIGLVREIHESGVTVVVIEHVMRIIARLCGHAIVLNQGRLLAEGTPQEVLTNDNVREAYLGKGFSL